MTVTFFSEVSYMSVTCLRSKWFHFDYKTGYFCKVGKTDSR